MKTKRGDAGGVPLCSIPVVQSSSQRRVAILAQSSRSRLMRPITSPATTRAATRISAAVITMELG